MEAMDEVAPLALGTPRLVRTAVGLGRRRPAAAAARALLPAGALLLAAGLAYCMLELIPRRATRLGGARPIGTSEDRGKPITLSVYDGLCLQRRGERKGSFVTVQFCSAENELQRWYYHADVDLIKTSRGLCMGRGAAQVHVWDCLHGVIGAHQHWKYTAQGQLGISGNHCLAADHLGIAVSTRPCSSSNPKQQWGLLSASAEVPSTRISTTATRKARSTIEKTTTMKATSTTKSTEMSITEKTTTPTKSTMEATMEKTTTKKTAESTKSRETTSTQEATTTPKPTMEVTREETTKKRTTAPELASAALPEGAAAAPRPAAEASAERATAEEAATEEATTETARTGVLAAERELERVSRRRSQVTVPAREFPLEVTQQILHGGVGLCLDAYSEVAHLWGCMPSASYQTWTMLRSHQLKTLGGKCLDAASSTLLSACDGATVTQSWYADAAGQIKTVDGQQCLYAPLPAREGDAVAIQACDPHSEAQRWYPTAGRAPISSDSPVGALLVLAVLLAAATAIFAQCCAAGPKVHITDPKPKAICFTDPRPGASQNHQVGIVAFGHPSRGPCDELSCASWLGSGFDLGADGVTVKAHSQDGPSPEQSTRTTVFSTLHAWGEMVGRKVNSALLSWGASPQVHTDADLAGASVETRSFRNAEAAFQALKFWQQAQEFRQLSAEEAAQKKELLRVPSQGIPFAGYGNEWSGMQAVLNSKFCNCPQLGRALDRTEDAFLLCHAPVPGGGQPWSDNSDGRGSNWLGMQLMLLRDQRLGLKQWTSFIEGSVDTATGELRASSASNTWQEAVCSARRALEAKLIERPDKDNNRSEASLLLKEEGVANAAAPRDLGGRTRS